MRERRKPPAVMSLNITSMMDMFTIILVFLLKTFGSSSVNIQVSGDLNLPKSSSQKAPEDDVLPATQKGGSDQDDQGRCNVSLESPFLGSVR